ncbi:MAG: hypothetical protein L0I79_06170, partial [Atopostipes sp.]|nr:hypothetical protein [Atopostipes sp.]
MDSFKKQLVSLATGELAAVIVFIFAYRSFNLGRASFITFSFLIFILVQGSLYWFYRYLLIVNQQRVHAIAIQLLRILKILNLIALVGIVIAIPMTQTAIKDLIVASAIFLFGVIEYVNYYWYRLSYGKSGFNIKILLNTGLKKSSINK